MVKTRREGYHPNLAGYLYETLETATIDQEDEDNLQVRGPTRKPGREKGEIEMKD